MNTQNLSFIISSLIKKKGIIIRGKSILKTFKIALTSKKPLRKEKNLKIITY
jgi:hypothetical protein